MEELHKFQTQAKLSVTSVDLAQALEKPLFLSEGDTELFEESLKNLLNQTEAFEHCEEEEDNKAGNLEFDDPGSLYAELSGNARKAGSYPELLVILQKLAGIGRKSVWVALEEIVKTLKELSEGDKDYKVPTNIRKLLKDAGKFEELEGKYDTLQLLTANQEKTIAKLKQELENCRQPMNIIPSPPKNLDNNTSTSVPNTNPQINPDVKPPPILPPPLLTTLKDNKSTSGMPAPPPPCFLKAPLLGVLQPPLPSKPKRTPKVPLKPLIWSTVPAAKLAGTIWARVDDSRIELDTEALERDFFLAGKTAKTAENEPRHAAEPSKVSILAPEKSKNLEIVLGKLKLDFEGFKRSLLSCEPNQVALESLANVMPSEAELKAIRDFDGDCELLAGPERFLRVILGVPSVAERVAALRFAEVQEEIIEELEGKLEGLDIVWRRTTEDDRFRKIIEYTLAVGNYLNGTSARGGFYIFLLLLGNFYNKAQYFN